MRGSTPFPWATGATLALLLAGCGGGDDRQDADEPAGNYQLSIVKASFPSEQSLAERATLSIEVRNDDSKEVPNVAVTLKSSAIGSQAASKGAASAEPGAFSIPAGDPELADQNRPVWIVDEAPKGGDTAYTNTWALGKLARGQSKTFQWKVTAVKAGTYNVKYQISPGLDGKAKLASGTGDGSFTVNIDATPPESRVNADGEVVRED